MRKTGTKCRHVVLERNGLVLVGGNVARGQSHGDAIAYGYIDAENLFAYSIVDKVESCKPGINRVVPIPAVDIAKDCPAEGNSVSGNRIKVSSVDIRGVGVIGANFSRTVAVGRAGCPEIEILGGLGKEGMYKSTKVQEYKS